MRTLETKEGEINIYDSINELPASLHSEFSIALLEAAEIGFGTESLKEHNRKILDFLSFKSYDSALEQAKNQKFCFDLTEQGYNPIRVAFCHLIHSINKEEPISRDTDYLLNQIKEISDDIIIEAVESVKKKSLTN